MQTDPETTTVRFTQRPNVPTPTTPSYHGSNNDLDAGHGLTTAQLNFDRTGKHSLPPLLAFADTHNVDALLLQDTANCNWSYLGLQDLGWIYLHHKTCAILLRTATAGRLMGDGAHYDGTNHQAVWRSQHYDSMGVTLTTPEGTLLLATAYIPTGTDNLPVAPDAPERRAVEGQHTELHHISQHHDHSIISLDGNETITKRGRVQTMLDGSTRLSGNERNTNMSASTMGCYVPTHFDAHRHLHGTNDDTYPGPADMTNTMGAQQSNGIRAIQSKIDYTLISSLACTHLVDCTIHHDPRKWARGKDNRTNYHASIVTRLEWPALWHTDDGLDPQPGTDSNLKGTTLKKHPNYSRMTATRAAKISKNVATAIQAARPTIRGIRRGCKDDSQKRDELYRILTNILYKEATKALGPATTDEPDHAAPPAAAEISVLWGELTRLVHLAIDRTLERYWYAPVTLDGPEIATIRDALAQHDISLPTTRAAWVEWWKNVDTHRIKALGGQNNLILSDRLATTNPKQYYRQATRPMSSSKIMSIRTAKGTFASDKGIETALTDYLRVIGSKPEEEPNPPGPDEECIRPDPVPNPQLKSVMDAISTDTLLHIARTIDSTSSPGFDGIAPSLIKICLLTPWHERRPKTKSDLEQEGLAWKFHTENYGNRHAEGHREGYHMPAMAPPNPNLHISQMVEPTTTRELFIELLNLCLKTRDIPATAKHGITTGLPKSEGLVTNTDGIRPISVGPAISRLLNKIVADRLSALLVRHRILNSAQFAFLPGGDIHEPINSTIACYNDSAKYAKACYAVFYDMSKAYDTLRWSSIRQAIRRIGLGTDFEDFVMNTLKGTTLAMRTNLPGRVTPTVEMHKAVKQGCPLAPLLFIIVMDELHASLASSTGYSLGPPNADSPSGVVKSRGYCDDTGIISNSYEGLREMNSIVMAFFAKHGFRVNRTKTKVTGRHADGTALAPSGPGPHPAGALESFMTVPPDSPIKYLGALITLTLNWKPQIQKMNTSILLLVRHLDAYRTTTVQATCITKFVTGPRLEIGLRHAHVPIDQLNTWDTWIANALARRAGLGADRLHKSGVARICRLTPLADQNDLIKATYAMEQLTRPSDLRDHYNTILNPIITRIHRLAGEWETNNLKLFRPQLTDHPAIAGALKRMAIKGMRVIPNDRSTFGSAQRINHYAPSKNGRTGAQPAEEGDEAGDAPTTTTFKGIPIPVWMTHDLWGSRFNKHQALATAIHNGTAPPKLKKWADRSCKATDTTYHHPDCHPCPPAPKGKRKHNKKRARKEQTKPRPLADCMLNLRANNQCPHCKALWLGDQPFIDSLIKVTICTDGSTYTGKRSASAMVFCEDGMRHKELWQEKGFYWTIDTSNNYHAELSALHRAIRSVPVNVNLTIHTDSLSAVQSIAKALRSPERTNYLRVAGRPYIRSICYATDARRQAGATTSIHHVRAHTGGRNMASIGNAAADRLAKWQAWADELPDSSISLIQNEYAYVLHETQWHTPSKGPPTEHCNPIHDDTRTAMRKHLASLQMKEWAQREKRGQLARTNPSGTAKAIDNLWAWAPSSSALRMALVCLNQVTPKTKGHDGSYRHELCTRCGTKSARSPLHRIRGCPHNGPDNRRLEQLLDRLTGFRNDQSDLQADGPISIQQGTLPSALPDLVTANRSAIKKAVTTAKGIRIATRTMRFPLLTSDGRDATLDSQTDIGQMALLYTLTTQPPPLPAPHPTPTFHEGGSAKPQGPVFSLFRRPNPPPKEDRRWGNRCCYTCGNRALLPTSCPIHRTCLDHQPAEGIKCDFCDYARRTPMTATPGSIARTLDRLVLHTTTQPGHTTVPALRNVCRQILRTYSDLHLNPLTARHPWDSSWYTDDQGCVALGGTYNEDPTTFLTDRYTFICPTEPDVELRDLATAATAAEAATGPTRSVHLMTNTADARRRVRTLRTDKHMRIHTLAHFPPGTLHTHDSKLELYDHHQPKVTNGEAMILVLLENGSAPGFHPSDLITLLEPLGAMHVNGSPPWTYPSLPPDIERSGLTPEPPPSHPLLRPSTLFYRGDKNYTSLTHNYLVAPDPAPKVRPADSIPNTLCQMGITPPGLQKAITSATELRGSDYSASAAQIPKIIFDSSLALFLKDEGYHKWKRKH
jgi:hypothetical protein